MGINNSFTAERIKKALSLRIVATVLLVVAIISVIFYITIENYESREVLIWFVTTDVEAGFSNDKIKNINDYNTEKGIDRTLIVTKHPEDRYFDVTMSTRAFYVCDAFIMQKDMAEEYYDLDMFLPLSADGFDADNLLCVHDVAIGIYLDDDYYFLINKNTDIDPEIIYDIYEMLVKN